MYAVFIVGVILWLLYGIVLGAWPIIIANCMTALLAGSVLWMKWRFTRSETPGV